MNILIVRLLAKDDIQQIVDYYDEKAPFITDTFLVDLYEDFEIIKKNPFLFREKYKSTRVRFMKQFPFGIHYRVKKKKIEVLAVLHTSRNPIIWKQL